MNFQTILDMIALRRKPFAFVAFLALLAVGLGSYLSMYQQPELERAQRVWFAKRDALARGESQTDAARYRRGVRDLDELEKRFAPKRDFARLIGRLYDTAASNGLTLEHITYKPGKKVEATQLIPYGVSFDVSGNYGAIKRFLAEVSRYQEMITVDGVALSNQSYTQEKVGLRIQTTFYLKSEGA